MNPHHRRRGLSLVELLVVIGIIAVVTAMLLTTMRKVWKVVHELQSSGGTRFSVVHQDGSTAAGGYSAADAPSACSHALSRSRDRGAEPSNAKNSRSDRVSPKMLLQRQQMEAWQTSVPRA